MSRGLSATNEAQVDLNHVHEVTLIRFDFDTPVYVHSGLGTITYDTNDYVGVGQLGSVSNITERLSLSPAAVNLQLSKVDATLVSEALDSGNFGDNVFCYVGFRQDDGTLVADPELVWSGTFDHASAKGGAQSIIEFVCQHDLAALQKSDGARFSDADQKARYPADTGFQFAARMAGLKLEWGGGSVATPRGGGGRPRNGDLYLR